MRSDAFIDHNHTIQHLQATHPSTPTLLFVGKLGSGFSKMFCVIGYSSSGTALRASVD